MAVRSSMAAIISRVRLLISDTAGASQVFADQDIQDVLDSTRMDIRNVALAPSPTFAGTTMQYLDYFSDFTDWEDDLVLRQYLVTAVTPATSENIVGHWTFSSTTLPPIMITGKTYDVYRAAADLLERWAAKWVLAYSFSSDGQSFQRAQAAPALQNLAHTYRLKQRASTFGFTRMDMNAGASGAPSLAPTAIDYMGSG